MASQDLFLLLVLAVAAERGLELVITRRNARHLRARGGHEVGEAHYPWMALLHTGLLVGAPLEVYLLQRTFEPWLGWSMVGVLCATMALRYWAILTLGDRWTARVFVVPGESPVLGGPYRYFRHPNYLAVVLEVAALPLIHSAWLTAILGSVGNAFMLRTRIRVEEDALQDSAEYFEVLGDRPSLPFGSKRHPSTDGGSKST